ncbi:ARM repeat-containing protein [Tuber magnatum]|uniref:ARM repeat-containing protein n=1 Tax=Tuber magnatum TaxID=42249 RepID=A0A317STR6_9PEZI|nr:ARM repeat-containing protein [Tuber magnatum]
MEQEILRLLGETLSSQEGPRRNAETQITNLYGNDALPLALVQIASTTHLNITVRQSALLVLKRYVQHCWSDGFEEFTGPLASDGIKDRLRDPLLGLVTDEQRKIRFAASSIVSKIAGADFPERWPTLLQGLLNVINTKTSVEHQVHGALRVLADLVDDGFSDNQFFAAAVQIVAVAYGVADSEDRDYTIRALSVLIFYSCMEILEMVKDDHSVEVNAFAMDRLNEWFPFFIRVMSKPLPDSTDPTYEGCVTLNIQVIRTVMQVRKVFPSLFTPYLREVFRVTWSGLNMVKDRYVRDFITKDSQGKLINSDGLPRTLDLLVLEQLDFIQTCLKSKPLRDELLQASRGAGVDAPLTQMVVATVALGQVAKEDEGLWEVDLNIFLCEESAISANYTPRTASGDLILKLGEWFQTETEEALWAHTEQIFDSGVGSRQMKEAALFAWDQLLTEFAEIGLKINSGTAANLLNYVATAISTEGEENQLLRARGYFLAGTLTKSNFETVGFQVAELVTQTLRGAANDSSSIVKISCIKVFQKYCETAPSEIVKPCQPEIISAIRTFLATKEKDDAEDSQDVLGELLETIRVAVGLDYSAVLNPNLQIIDLVFAIAQNGPRSPHLGSLIHEIIADVTEELFGSFVQLCSQVLPFISTSLAIQPGGKEHPLMNLAADILAVLVHNGSEPLPNGFVVATVPHLARILLHSEDTEVLQAGCEAFKEIVKHDIKQLLEWHDGNGKSALEVSLIIIDRLLRPETAEGSALEVGGLAAEIVEKAGDHLGPYLPELLGAVARRLATAKTPSFIQSLILVFARLVLKQAKDVVEFLAGLSIGDSNGLQVVINAWLANSSIFSGYEEIRQNVFALCQLYRLEDPRLSQIMVQGDLIVPESNRIMTRSKAKQTPDQYTSVPVPVKIIKLLILELGSGGGDPGASFSGGTLDDEEVSDDGEWEDETSALGMAGMTREELLALGGSGRQSRQADDIIYTYLTGFFHEVSTQNIGGFQNVFSALKPEEQKQLSQLGSPQRQ